MKKFLLCMAMLALLASGCTTVLPEPTAVKVKTNNLIGENMVFQRNEPIVIWGTANPEGIVNVELNGEAASARADKDGKWKVELPPMKAGGPYELIITGKEKVVFKNIMLGDVWVCSGQSNMEWIVRNSNNAKEEIANANYPNIRLFTVPKKVSAKPLDNIPSKWVICSPKTVSAFSAVGYFFGRELNKDLNVPIGLIHTSWGGTPIEAWTSYQTMKDDPISKPIIDRYERALENYPEAFKKYQERLKKWKANRKGKTRHDDPGNVCFAKGWASPDFDDKDWKTMTLPVMWEDHDMSMVKLDGVVWFRKEITIPADWAGKELELHIGAVDDFDTTYFNNVKIGSTGKETPRFWEYPRIYKVPGNLVKAGRAVIAVRAFDHYGGGGFAGHDDMAVWPILGNHKPIELETKWKYKIAKAMDPGSLLSDRAPGPPMGAANPHSPAGLYNAMLSPLIPFRIKGAIWYQGESNAGRAWQYRTLMKMMIKDWREKWGQDFPFFMVQLANFRTPNDQPIESSWAELREAQSMATEMPKVGMAVIIDIGEAANIHPKNKQDVGRRLALSAEKIAYGKDIVHSGPTYKSMKVEGDKIILSFDNIGGGLVAKGGPLKRFEIASKDGRFVWANAKIEGDTVVVSSPDVKNPAEVRYAWSYNPKGCNLYNKEGLPASPFRTDKRKGITFNKK